MTKRSEQKSTTYERIVEAATRMFMQQGYEATSIEKLLEDLQISRGALYHHFDSKEKLFAAVFEQVERDVGQTIVEATRGISNPVQALQTGCDAFLRIVRDPDMRRLVLLDAPAVLGWQQWREIESRHGLGLLKASLNAAAAAGKLSADRVELHAHILLAALMETALLVAGASNSSAATRNGRATMHSLIESLLGGS